MKTIFHLLLMMFNDHAECNALVSSHPNCYSVYGPGACCSWGCSIIWRSSTIENKSSGIRQELVTISCNEEV